MNLERNHSYNLIDDGVSRNINLRNDGKTEYDNEGRTIYGDDVTNDNVTNLDVTQNKTNYR